MLYVKILKCGISDHKDASGEQTVIAADEVSFLYDREKRPFVKTTNKNTVKYHPLCGDVFVMTETGRTVSQFAVPNSFLGEENVEGWNGKFHDAIFSE